MPGFMFCVAFAVDSTNFQFDHFIDQLHHFAENDVIDLKNDAIYLIVIWLFSKTSYT